MNKNKKIVLAITGASGAIYGLRTLAALLGGGAEVWLCVSSAGCDVVRRETGLEINPREPDLGEICPGINTKSLRFVAADDLASEICSGSFRFDAMAIVPCSMRTLGAIASGSGDNAIHRAADVALKERRRLVVVPRETPLSTIHLKNMLEISRAGATVLPPSPAFYHKPQDIDSLIDFVVARLLDALGVDNDLVPRWTGK